MPTAVTVTVPFEITEWTPETYDEPADGPALARVVVRKAYTGALVGTGSPTC